jgi:hypothetical protein
MADKKNTPGTPEAPSPEPATESATKKPAAKAAKAPAIEEKPFSEFIAQHYLPTLDEALKAQGATIRLALEKGKIAVTGIQDQTDYWQVIGQWPQGGRQFNIVFLHEDIQGPKAFSCAAAGAKPSTIEQFMGDERKTTLDLLVLYTLQRLNGQKWLARN